jgi:hypothetical protein
MLSRNYIHISSRRERRSQCSITCRCFRHRKTLLMRPVNTSSSDDLERMIVLAGQGRQCSTSLLIFAALSFPARSSLLCCWISISSNAALNLFFGRLSNVSSKAWSHNTPTLPFLLSLLYLRHVLLFWRRNGKGTSRMMSYDNMMYE